MQITRLSIPDVLRIEPYVFSDTRGEVYESFHQARFEKAVGYRVNFLQDNHSISVHNVLRGLHYQVQKSQGKLVRVVRGSVFDVAVDLRRSSPTFGRWTGQLLSAANKAQLWIPEGFAHGFLVVSNSAEVVYKLTNYYAPEYERCIAWNDPELGVDWPLTHPPLMSTKDEQGLRLKDAEIFP